MSSFSACSHNQSTLVAGAGRKKFWGVANRNWLAPGRARPGQRHRAIWLCLKSAHGDTRIRRHANARDGVWVSCRELFGKTPCCIKTRSFRAPLTTTPGKCVPYGISNYFGYKRILDEISENASRSQITSRFEFRRPPMCPGKRKRTYQSSNHDFVDLGGIRRLLCKA